MRSSNRYKSHSEGSNRNIHEPVQTVRHHVQEQRLGNAATNPPRSDELLEHPEEVPQRGGNSDILQWIESTVIQTSDEKDKGIPFQKEGEKHGRSLSSFYQQATSQPTSEGKTNKKKHWRKPYYPCYRIPKI
ncbi:hypothetical protein O181_075569 [Austropuccinia psidii MF-1]|uniref:Uncharacterized protein n=1 Tax=Austropuccinia psidii MF-1 TaxID=1389203 RepID=A0A9Q3IEK9_9BASI|nr:hypothetical protein [Austropuccinia psidii MF-1]